MIPFRWRLLALLAFLAIPWGLVLADEDFVLILEPDPSEPPTSRHIFTLNEPAAASKYPNSCDCPVSDYCCRDDESWFDNLSIFGGIDGSKQPQDFGVNANLGGQGSVNWGMPVVSAWDLGLQVGTSFVASGNAVRVQELLGEATDRTQSFTTIGLYQRMGSGWAWGAVYDFLYEDSFDRFHLSQWRLRASFDYSLMDQFGITLNVADQFDNGLFNATPVTLRPITQGSLFWRKFWQTGVQTTAWMGIAESHSEDNVVTGPSPRTKNTFLFGADILAPLSDHLAIYGEANLMMPADTGCVDAFLGIQWTPWMTADRSRLTRFAPLLPVAAPTSFSVDLRQ